MTMTNNINKRSNLPRITEKKERDNRTKRYILLIGFLF